MASKYILFVVVVVVNLEPKTEPSITAAMNTSVNKNIGIKNVFL
jgi:hypothetical protein